MILSLRQIKRRIRSVTNTKKITKAMEMVAASKLKRYQNLLGQTRLFHQELERMLNHLIAATPELKHPLCTACAATREPKETLVFLIASDSGLCGSYNYNLFQATENFIQEHRAKNAFFAVGRHGVNYLKRQNFKVVGNISVPKPADVQSAIDAITTASKSFFLEGRADRIYLIYTEFISMASFKPKIDLLLPLELLRGENKPVVTERFILEPDAEKISAQVIPYYLEQKVALAVKEALVSEQVSRMIAMKQATENAEEMIETLTLHRNKARQAAITKEIIEVVGGSRAQQLD